MYQSLLNSFKLIQGILFLINGPEQATKQLSGYSYLTRLMSVATIMVHMIVIKPIIKESLS